MPRSQIPQPEDTELNHSTRSGLTSARYRLTFGKGRELRFTGHLDLHRAWERTFRRAKVSLAYSEGYHPRPKINIGAALPLGSTSEGDLLDVELTEEIETEELLEALRAAAPPGLSVEAVEVVGAATPKLQKLIRSSEYVVPIGEQDARLAELRIEELLNVESLPRVRKGKYYDLRPLIEELGIDDLAGQQCVKMQLAARSGATGRPDEVLLALGLDVTPLVPHRMRLIWEPNGEVT